MTKKGSSSNSNNSFAADSDEKPAARFTVRDVLTVRNKHREDLKEAFIKQLDAITDRLGRSVVLELVSTELYPKTKAPKRSKRAVLKDWSEKSNIKAEKVQYSADFTLDSDFRLRGAITVSNKHQREFFLESITLEGFAFGPVHFPCNSWVQSTKHQPAKRIFFSNENEDEGSNGDSQKNNTSASPSEGNGRGGGDGDGERDTSS